MLVKQDVGGTYVEVAHIGFVQFAKGVQQVDCHLERPAAPNSQAGACAAATSWRYATTDQVSPDDVGKRPQQSPIVVETLL